MNVLGKFAKGVGDVVLGNDKRGPAEEVEVEQYLQRVSDGVLPEDRREALAQLRDLLYDNAQAQKAVGNGGFPVLCSIIREERGNVEMLRGALECLAIALGHPAAGGGSSQQPDGQRRGAMNAELFARGKDNVGLLLSLLEEDQADFYVRYHAVQLLTCCAMAGSYRLQEAILAAPLGVNRLLGMMEEGHEVIRNEAILLLVGLTRASPELQKIAAFQGAFGRLLHIVREEGGAEGGMIVQDCMELLNNLLRGNQQTQLMFREEGHATAVAALLSGAAGGGTLSRQKAANLAAMLQTLLLLLAPGPPGQQDAGKKAARAANQAALVQGGALEAVLGLAVERGGVSAPEVRIRALRAVSLLIAGAQAHAQRVMGAQVGSAHGPLSALQAILRVALGGREAGERVAADGIVRAFCIGNAEGQSMLAATLMPVGGEPTEGEESDRTFGGELVRALSSADVGVCGRAAAALSHVLAGNLAAKERVLRTPLQIPRSESDAPQLLLPRLVARVAALLSSPKAGGSAGAAHLLRALVTWLQDCPPAVTAFLSTSSHLPLLLDIVHKRRGDGCTLVTGLAAVLLGECLIYNGDSSQGGAGMSSSTVLDYITSQLGLAAYFGCLDDLKACPAFRAAASSSGSAAAGGRGPSSTPPGTTMERDAREGEEEDQGEGPGPSTDVQALDREFVMFLPRFEEDVRRRAMSLFGGKGPAGPSVETQALAGASDAEKLKAAEDVIRALQRWVQGGSKVGRLSCSPRPPPHDQLWGEEAAAITALWLYAFAGQCREVEDLRAKGATLLQQAMAPGGVRAAAGAQPANGGDSAAKPLRSPQMANGAPESQAGVREAESRAAKAEAEAAALRFDLNGVQSRVGEAEAAVLKMQRVADEARGNAAKWEADLEDLSRAYAGLEKHAFQLEERLAAAEEAAAAAAAEATQQAAVRDGEAAAAPGPSDRDSENGDSEDEGNADEGLNDLLICLGQEERKVEVLSARLVELGEDPAALLEGLLDVEDAEAEEGEPEEEDLV